MAETVATLASETSSDSTELLRQVAAGERVYVELKDASGRTVGGASVYTEGDDSISERVKEVKSDLQRELGRVVFTNPISATRAKELVEQANRQGVSI